MAKLCLYLKIDAIFLMVCCYMRFTITASHMSNPVFCSKPFISFNLKFKKCRVFVYTIKSKGSQSFLSVLLAIERKRTRWSSQLFAVPKCWEIGAALFSWKSPVQCHLNQMKLQNFLGMVALQGPRVWTIPFTLSENTGVVINKIPLLPFLFTSHTIEPLCLWNVGRKRVGETENIFSKSVAFQFLLTPLVVMLPYLWEVGRKRVKCLKVRVLKSWRMGFNLSWATWQLVFNLFEPQFLQLYNRDKKDTLLWGFSEWSI